MIRFLLAVVVVLALLVAWHLSPLAEWLHPTMLRDHALLFGLAFIVAAAAFVPLTFLLLQTGVLMGAGMGIAISAGAVVIAASLGFVIGRLLPRLPSERLPRLRQALASNAVASIAVVRFFPIAPFQLFNIAAGASACSYGSFIAGSVLGLLPGIVLCNVFGFGVWELLFH